MTVEEFYEVGDNWYQRAHRLRGVWQDVRETDIRRAKAFKLWSVMYGRVIKLVPIAVKINQVYPKGKSGGV